MPTLKNCSRCGKVFNAEGPEELCADCNIAESRDLKKVTEFLKENPLASIMDVNKKTGVSQQLIFRLVKNGSLKMRQQPEQFKCRLCGKAIKNGILCGDCRSKVENMKNKGKKGQ